MQRTLSPLAPENRIGNLKTYFFDNGLRTYIREKKDVPVVSVQAWVKTGSIHEGKYLGCGLSHFLEHMMFQGTENYPGHSIVENVNSFGGEINAYTSHGCTVYYIDCPADSAEKAVDMLADMISAPLFPLKKFHDEKNVILRERDMNCDNPSRVISEKLWQNAFEIHPVRHPVIGYKDKIQEVGRDTMLDYYNNRYSPHRSFFVISGHVDPDKAAAFVEKKLGSWKFGMIDEPCIPEEPEKLVPRFSAFNFKDPLTRVSIGFNVPGASNPDIPALDVLSAILGQSRSSRFANRIKDKKHLAINISSYNYTPYFCGLFGISAICQPEKKARLKEEIFKELSKVREENVSRAEVAREVNQQVADYVRSLRSNSSIARVIGNAILTCGGPDYADRYLESISKVTSEEIFHVANKYICEQNSTVIELLPETASTVRDKTVKPDKRKPQPAAEMEKTDTGQKIITYPEDSLPLVDLSVVLPGGVILENGKNAGISKLLSALLSCGTLSMDESKLAEMMDDNAIDLSISSGNNTLVIRMNFHSEKTNTALDILKSIMKEIPVLRGALP